MDCTACVYANQEGAKFCSDCGAPLPRGCSSCGHELSPTARFCDRCGTPTSDDTSTSSASEEAVRKTVTVLFADLVGSTAFGERVDAESARDVLAEYHAMTRTVIEEHGGFLAKFIGDGVMALFGVPETAEDDAPRAIEAALALQASFLPVADRATGRHGAELGLRVGINTGEVVIASGDDDLVGDALNTAARLEAACNPGRVLVGESTWRLTRGAVRYEALGEIQAKGKAEPIATYQVVSASLDDDDRGTPFVGRADELARLREVFEEAVSAQSARLATVVGSPGVGKTRLSGEFCLEVGPVTTLVEIRCRRSGAATFAPIADMLRAATNVDDDNSPDEVRSAVLGLVEDLDDANRVTDLLASFLGTGPTRSTEEAFFAVRRLIEAMSRRHPVVLVVDDIQWAEPLFLDLLEHLAEWVQDAPTLILTLARPEIREIRSSFATENRTVRAAIALEGLDADATAELAAKLVGSESLPTELIERLPASTEGNPLFVRELMRMLVDDGVIAETDGHWELTIEADAVEVPPTIQSLLSARLDRMPADERKLVELASVVGSEFPLGAVLAISEPGSSDMLRLRGAMDRLRRRELVEPTGKYWGDEPVYRFHHVLIRDAAYRRLLKRVRADLHARVGEWTERTVTDLPGDHEATIAFHFEQSFAYRRELSEDDEDTIGVGRHAAALLQTAAQRALERDDIAAAGTLAERAVACLEPDDPEVPDLLMLGCEALLALGDVPRGEALLNTLKDAQGDVRQDAWTTCFDAQMAVLAEPGSLPDVLWQLEAAAETLASLGDHSGVAKARLVRAGALARLGRIGHSESELDLALTAARSADDRRRVAAVLGVAPVAALWGPSPIPRAGGRCLDVIRLLRITTGSPSVEAVSTRCQAVLEALRGRFDTARTMLAAARGTVEELGLRHEVLETDLYAGIVELLAHDPDAAEQPLRDAYTGLTEMGIDTDAGQAAAYLARALLQLGRLDEADELAGSSDALAGQTPQTGITTHAVQAEVLAAQGRTEEALRLAREAVEIATGTDLVMDHADANAVLARVAATAGLTDEARDAAAAATVLSQSKGATVARLRADELDEPLSQYVSESDESTDQSQSHTADGRTAATDEAPHTAPQAESGRHSGQWNRAAEAHEQYFRLHVVGEFEQAHTLFADDVEIDDRRAIVGATFSGREEIAAAYDTRVFDPERSSAETLASRGANLALRRCVRHSSENRRVEYLAVIRVDANGLIDRVVSSGAGDLAAAIDELDRQYTAELAQRNDVPNLALELRQREMNDALISRDLDRWFAQLDPDGEIVDHRPLGWGNLSIRDAVERLETLRDLPGDLYTYTARMLRRQEPVSLEEQVLVRTSREGAVQEERSLMLSVSPNLIARIEQFGLDQMEEAQGAFERELGDADSAPRNTASQQAGILHVAITSWGRPIRALLADNCTVRKPSGTVVTADLGSISDADELRRLGIGMATHRVLGVSGERLALAELKDEVDGAAVHRVAVEEIDTHARLCSVTQFEPTIDGLRSALGLMSDRNDEIEPPGAALALVRRLDHLRSQGDIDGVRSMVSPSFEFVDHREMGFGNLGAEAFLDMMAASSELTDEILLPQGFFAGNDRVLVTHLMLVVVQPSGELDERSSMCLVHIVESGRLVRQEIFEEAAKEAALARFEELTAELTDVPDKPWNRADEWCRQSFAMYATYDREGWQAHFSDNIVFDDRRPLIGGESEGRGDFSERWWAISDVAIDAYRLITIATRGERFVLQRHEVRTDDGTSWNFLAIYQLGDDGLIARMIAFDGGDLTSAREELDRCWFDTLTETEQNTVMVALRWGRAAASWDLDAFDELMSHDFRGYGGRELRLGWFDREQWLDLLRARRDIQGGFETSTVDAVELISPNTMVIRFTAVGHDHIWESAWEEHGLSVIRVSGDGVVRVGAFAPGNLADARAWADSLDPERGFDNLARRVALRMLGAMNDGTLTDRVDEFFEPDWRRFDNRSVINSGVIDAATHSDYTDALDSHNSVEPVAIRGDFLSLSRGVTTYENGNETIYLVMSEVSPTGKQVRAYLFDEDAHDEAMAMLDRRWYESLGPEAQRTVRMVMRYRRASANWDVPAFDELLSNDFEAFDGSRLGGGSMDRSQFLASQRARGELEGGADQSTLDLVELQHPDVLVARLRSKGRGSQFGAEWEQQWIVVHQIVDDQVRRFGLFDYDDLERARAWAISLESASGVEPGLDNLAQQFGQRWLAALNEGTTEDRLDEFFEPGWERVDHRSVIGSGAIDATTQSDHLAAIHARRRATPLAIRGDHLLLARGVAEYEAEFESTYLVMSEVSPAGKQVRVDVFDEDALDEAVTEMDRRWTRTLTDEERAALRVTGEFGRAFMEQDHAVFDRILHPDFTTIEHGIFQGDEFDRAGWETAHRDRNDVFGRGRLLVDIVELPSPRVVLSRTIQTGTSENGVAWEAAEWNVLQIADGKIIRAEVLDAHPEIAQADRARHIAGELVAQDTRGPLSNCAVRIASAVAAAWNTGDSGSRFYTANFEPLDRRGAELEPDVPSEDFLSTVLSGLPGLPGLPTSKPHYEIGDGLLAYDDSFALLPLRIAVDGVAAELDVLIAVACDDDGQLTRAAVFEPEQEDAARRELTLWWAADLQPRRMEVSQLAVDFGESWVAPTTRPLGDMMTPGFRLVDGRTLGLGDLGRDGFIQALVGREDDGTTGAPLPSRVAFVSDDILVFRAANRGITPGTGVEWEEIACNVFVTDGRAVLRVEMFDEDQWDAAVARARAIADGAYHRS